MARLLAVLILLGAPDSSRRADSLDLARFELPRRFSALRCSTLSPAGDTFAHYTGGGVTVYDLKQEKEARTLQGHNARPHDSGWSRDGRFLATTGFDGAVRVWEVASGREFPALTPHPPGYA